MNQLTKRQEHMYNFIVFYIRKNRYSPTYQDIADKFRITVSGARQQILIIAKKGFIEVDAKKSRSIRIKES